MTTTVLLWIWPLVVLGSVAAVGLIVTNRDDARRRRQRPGE